MPCIAGLPNVKMDKTLIVNADDFGLSPFINRGILKCFKEGILTSASILSNGDAFEEAARLAKEARLNVGIHLTLMDGRPLSPPGRVKSLVGSDGLFLKNYIDFSMKYFFSKIALSDIETEFRLQIEKFISAGLTPKHINGHNHVHMFPGVLDITMKLMGEFDIKKMRIPCAGISPFLKNISSNSFAKLFLVALAALARRKISKQGFTAPDNFEGLFVSGKLGKKAILDIIERLGEGTTELMCHPGYGDSGSETLFPWNYQWEEEMNALCDQDVRAKIDGLGIRLAGF